MSKFQEVPCRHLMERRGRNTKKGLAPWMITSTFRPHSLDLDFIPRSALALACLMEVLDGPRYLILLSAGEQIPPDQLVNTFANYEGIKENWDLHVLQWAPLYKGTGRIGTRLDHEFFESAPSNYDKFDILINRLQNRKGVGGLRRVPENQLHWFIVLD